MSPGLEKADCGGALESIASPSSYSSSYSSSSTVIPDIIAVATIAKSADVDAEVYAARTSFSYFS
jgi:hypothetical protein